MKRSLMTLIVVAQLIGNIAQADLSCSGPDGTTLQSFTLGEADDFNVGAQKVAAILKKAAVTSLLIGEGHSLFTRVGKHISLSLQNSEGEAATAEISVDFLQQGHCTRAGCPSDPFVSYLHGTLTYQSKDYALTCSEIL